MLLPAAGLCHASVAAQPALTAVPAFQRVFDDAGSWCDGSWIAPRSLDEYASCQLPKQLRVTCCPHAHFTIKSRSVG
jgi:hypothetical protein